MLSRCCKKEIEFVDCSFAPWYECAQCGKPCDTVLNQSEDRENE